MKNEDRQLNCYRVGCYGQMEYVDDDEADVLYRCVECEKTLAKSSVERLKDDYDGPISQLATVLYDGVCLND
jgi:hypothetical protein